MLSVLFVYADCHADKNGVTEPGGRVKEGRLDKDKDVISLSLINKQRGPMAMYEKEVRYLECASIVTSYGQQIIFEII